MNSLDLFFLVVLGIGVWRGFRSGLAKQLVATIGLFLAFVIAAGLMGPVGSAVVERIGFSERTAPVVGFVVLFAGILGGVAAIGHAFRKGLEAIKLSSVDTMAGAFLAGLKAALSLSILLLVTGFSPMPGGGPWLIGEETRDNSVLCEPLRAVAPQVWNILQAVAPGIQDALFEKFNSWQEGRDNPDAAPSEESVLSITVGGALPILQQSALRHRSARS